MWRSRREGNGSTKHTGHDSGDIEAGGICCHHDATWHAQNQESGQHSRAHSLLDSFPHACCRHLWSCNSLHSNVGQNLLLIALIDAPCLAHCWARFFLLRCNKRFVTAAQDQMCTHRCSIGDTTVLHIGDRLNACQQSSDAFVRKGENCRLDNSKLEIWTAFVSCGYKMLRGSHKTIEHVHR